VSHLVLLSTQERDAISAAISAIVGQRENISAEISATETEKHTRGLSKNFRPKFRPFFVFGRFSDFRIFPISDHGYAFT
jgi:hypothetical protein